MLIFSIINIPSIMSNPYEAAERMTQLEARITRMERSGSGKSVARGGWGSPWRVVGAISLGLFAVGIMTMVFYVCTISYILKSVKKSMPTITPAPPTRGIASIPGRTVTEIQI